ncbi:MAG: alpha/beta fold hydrolase [Gammaproteobacteria bacterium]|nr:alpha/beta fold hydrolase [Gammaproteobacteria bacterium]
MSRLSLNCSTQGEGDPLLIIHGLFGSSRNWKSLAKQFSEGFQVILLDLRNHGDSPFDLAMDYEVMVDDVIELMGKLSIQSAHILGHSMGGKVAMKLNQLYPERVNKLVIADIAPIGYTHDHDEIIDPVLELDLSTIISRKDADNQLEASIPDQRIRLFLLQNLAFKQGKARWNLNWKALKENMNSIVGYEDISHWSLHNPCLFIRGELSDYITDKSWNLITQHFTAAEKVTLANAGHWLHAEQPAAFYDAVVKFIRS